MHKDFRQKFCAPFSVKIWIAGNIQTARLWASQYVLNVGEPGEPQKCVTITPTTYVYAGGEEEGMIVGLVNYPRFPNDFSVIKNKAIEFGQGLAEYLGQSSYLIETPDEMLWFTRKEGA